MSSGSHASSCGSCEQRNAGGNNDGRFGRSNRFSRVFERSHSESAGDPVFATPFVRGQPVHDASAPRPARPHGAGAAPRPPAQQQQQQQQQQQPAAPRPPVVGPTPAALRDNPGVMDLAQAERGMLLGTCPTLIARLAALPATTTQIELQETQDRAHAAIWQSTRRRSRSRSRTRSRSRSRSRSRERDLAQNTLVLEAPPGTCHICLREDNNVVAMNDFVISECKTRRRNLASIALMAYHQLTADDSRTRTFGERALEPTRLASVQAHVRGCLYDDAVVTLRLLENGLNMLDHTLATGTIATSNENGCRASIFAPGVEQRVKIFTELVLKIRNDASSGDRGGSKAGKRAIAGGKAASGVTDIPRMLAHKGKVGLTAACVTQTTATTTTTTTHALVGQAVTENRSSSADSTGRFV